MSDCGRDCACRGETSRRDLLKIGLGTAGVLAGTRRAKAAPGHQPPKTKQPPPKAWFDELLTAAGPIVYRREQLKNLIFPLGGIGTGSIWLDGSARLVNWQIFNNIQKNSLVDDSFFAVRIEHDGQVYTRILQTGSPGGLPGFPELEFVGQYPIATVRFIDPELPVSIELEAWNPLVPLEEQDSAIPCAIFQVRAINRSNKPARVWFLGTLQNAVGHSGVGAARGVQHGTYGGNRNRAWREDNLAGVTLSADPGKPATIEPPIALMVDHQAVPLVADAPVAGLSIVGVGESPRPAGIRGVYWISNGDLRQLGGAVLEEIARGVRDGAATLLLSGAENPLASPVTATVPPGTERLETVFASFDEDSFGRWETEGHAFRRPQPGAVRKQNPVTGHLGSGLVNSFDPDDGPHGRLLSPRFTIKRRYISMLLGGGQKLGAVGVNLLVNGKAVLSATGKNAEHLERIEWDVSPWMDAEAQIEFIDRSSDGWGHILADDIRFSNLPIDAVTQSEAAAWNALLEEARRAPAMTAANVGRGRVMIVPAELGRPRPGSDRTRQRDGLLEMLASLAGSEYRAAVGRPETAPSFGTMCLATPHREADVRTAWSDRAALLRSWAADATLGEEASHEPTSAGQTVNAAISVPAAAPAGMTVGATFFYTWHFPNQYYPQNAWKVAGNSAIPVGNMYANWFHDAAGVARHLAADLPRLERETRKYVRAMFDSTLPAYLVDAAAANVSILRSPTCFWIKDGTFYGFEGCSPDGGGCCPMNCSHVWNYEQTLAHFWPQLERNMRITELDFHMQDDGGVYHRVEVPRTSPTKRSHTVADGQCGAILKAWREHLRSPDRQFLDQRWPNIRKAMDFAISHYDKDADGVMEQPQFNTYDRVIYGKNTFVSSLYLAALRAAEEMAWLARDDATAKRYRGLFEKGRDWMAANLFNGEYYIQIADNINLGYGKGCWSDQVVGQWWARVLNLGDILPANQVRSALTAVFKYNWLWSQEGFEGTQRFLMFADGKDKGLLCGSWPQGGRPEDPILYRDEIWTGVEYQVAAHKLYEGQITEGLSIVRGVRERYDGRKKSPWNEIECGDYYVRAMSSWSLLLAAQGYVYDGPAGRLGFNPRIKPEDHRSFFTTAQGWGQFEQKREKGRQTATLSLFSGRCDLRELTFGVPEGVGQVRAVVRQGGTTLLGGSDVTVKDGAVQLRLRPITLLPEEPIRVELTWG